MSALKISKEFETCVMSRWKFKWKVQQAMKSSKHNPLKGEVHIDEFYIGEPEEGNQGRSLGKKGWCCWQEYGQSLLKKLQPMRFVFHE